MDNGFRGFRRNEKVWHNSYREMHQCREDEIESCEGCFVFAFPPPGFKIVRGGECRKGKGGRLKSVSRVT